MPRIRSVNVHRHHRALAALAADVVGIEYDPPAHGRYCLEYCIHHLVASGGTDEAAKWLNSFRFLALRLEVVPGVARRLVAEVSAMKRLIHSNSREAELEQWLRFWRQSAHIFERIPREVSLSRSLFQLAMEDEGAPRKAAVCWPQRGDFSGWLGATRPASSVDDSLIGVLNLPGRMKPIGCAASKGVLALLHSPMGATGTVYLYRSPQGSGDEPVAPVEVKNGATGMLGLPDEDAVLVWCRDGGKVQVLSVTDGATIEEYITPGLQPWSAIIDPHHLAICSRRPDKKGVIQVFDRKSGAERVGYGLPSFRYEMAFVGDRFIWWDRMVGSVMSANLRDFGHRPLRIAPPERGRRVLLDDPERPAMLVANKGGLLETRCLVSGEVLSTFPHENIRDVAPFSLNGVSGVAVLTREALLFWADPYAPGVRLPYGDKGSSEAISASHQVDLFGGPTAALVVPSTDHPVRISEHEPRLSLSSLEVLPSGAMMVVGKNDWMFVSAQGDVSHHEGHSHVGSRLENQISAVGEDWLLHWSDDGQVDAHSQSNGEVLARLKGHTAVLLGAAVMSNDTVATWSQDQTLRYWNVQSAIQHSLRAAVDEDSGEIEDVFKLANPDLLLGLAKQSGRLVRLSSEGKVETELVGHQQPVLGAAVVSGGVTDFVTWSKDELVGWSVSGERTWGPVDAPKNLEIIQTENHCLFWFHGQLGRLNPSTGEIQPFPRFPVPKLGGLCPVGDVGVSWSEPAFSTARIRESIGHPSRKRQFLPGFEYWDIPLVYRGSRPRRTPVANRHEPEVFFVDLAEGTYRVPDGQPHTQNIHGVTAIGGQQAVSWGDDGVLVLWDVIKAEPLAQQDLAAGEVLGAMARNSPDGEPGIVVWTRSGNIFMWVPGTGFVDSVPEFKARAERPAWVEQRFRMQFPTWDEHTITVRSLRNYVEIESADGTSHWIGKGSLRVRHVLKDGTIIVKQSGLPIAFLRQSGLADEEVD